MQDTHRNDAITWFEIPATDLARAAHFYETMGPYRMAVFPHECPGIGGCLVHGDGYLPSADGNVVYVNASPSIDAAIERATVVGGRVTLPKTAVPGGMGFFAHIIDSEGNRVGLHAPA